MQTAMTGADAWYWFCKGFGNLRLLSNPYVSAYDTPMLGSVIALIVQWFFCYRIWTLSRSWLLSGFIALVSLMGSAAGFLSGIRGAIIGDFSVARAQIDLIALYIWLIGSAAADALIAGSLTFLLMRSRSTQHKQSSDILYRIVRLTVETNIASASVAIISLILYFAAPHDSFFISPTYFLGKIYANTLLVTFNNRVLLAKSTQNNQTSVATTSTITNARPTPTVTGYRYNPSSGPHTVTLNSETPRSAETFKMESYVDIESVPSPNKNSNTGVHRGPDARFGGYPTPPRPSDLYKGSY
jgi:hypothetical protein